MEGATEAPSTDELEKQMDEMEETQEMQEVGRNESLRVSIDQSGAVIAVGDIDLAGGPLLEQALLQHDSTDAIVIDLAAVEFIDSSGLRSLLSASRRAQAGNTTVTLRRPSSGVLRLLSITGTTTQFVIAGDDE